MTAPPASGLNGRLAGFWSLWREELQATPARWRGALRLTLVCALGLAVVFYFHIPDGMYFVLFLFAVNTPDAWPSLRKAWFRGLGTICGGAIALVSVAALADQPWLFVVAQTLIIALTLFLSVTTTIPYATILMGFMFLLLTPTLAASPESSLGDALWRIALATAGAVLGTAARLTLWPDDPEQQLIESMAARLETIAELLERAQQTRGNSRERDLTSTAALQLGSQLEFLAAAEARHPNLRARHPEQAKLITDLERLLLDALRLDRMTQDTPLRGELWSRLALLRDWCQTVARRLPRRESAPVLPEAPPFSQAAEQEGPVIAEIERTLRGMAPALESLTRDSRLDVLGSALDEGTIHDRFRLRTTGFSLSNLDAVRYSLKGTLAAMVCYLIYQGLNWPGLATSVATCVLVAQLTVGAGVSRALLIFGGALMGALSGLAVMVVFMPNLFGLASFLAVCAVFIFAAGWINLGSSRVSYLGVQMMLALSMVLFASPGPTLDLAPAGDRVLGVLIGITVMCSIDFLLWPNFAGDALRRKLEATLRTLARLPRAAAQQDWTETRHLARGVHRNFAETLNLYSAWQLEFGRRAARGAWERGRWLKLTHQAEEAYLALLAVIRERKALNLDSLPAPWPQAIREFDERLAQYFEGVGANIVAPSDTSEPPGIALPIESPDLAADQRLETRLQSLGRLYRELRSALRRFDLLLREQRESKVGNSSKVLGTQSTSST